MRSVKRVLKAISWLFLVALHFQAYTCVFGEPTAEELENIVNEIRNRDTKSLKNARGRADIKRQILPEGDVFDKLRPLTKSLECGGTYSIAAQGFIFFRPDSNQQTCNIHFVGSTFEHCNVAFVCEDYAMLEGNYKTGGNCSKGYINLSDGTHGESSDCGKADFRHIPRIPHNMGSDLFVQYRGKSNSSCLAFCAEDLKVGSRSKISSKPKKLEKNLGPEKTCRICCSSDTFDTLNVNKQCVCGIRGDLGREEVSGRVVGGTDALRFEFPWLGALTLHTRFSEKYYERRPFCGGALINDRYFISAAHCFMHLRPAYIQIVLHAHVMNKRGKEYKADPNNTEFARVVPGWDLPDAKDADEGSIRLDVEEIISHPLYDSKTYDYDIAILRLKDGLNFTKSNKTFPLCLPTLEKIMELHPGDKMVAAGWGRVREEGFPPSRLLQKADLKYFDWGFCRKKSDLAERHICVGEPGGGKDTCQGDSGGPLVAMLDETKNQYYLSGVVSAGIGCARDGFPGWYTNVQEVLQWVYHETADANWCKI